jgi:hypothetical protein
VSIETNEEIEMNKIEQRVQRYKEDSKLLSDTLPITDNILTNLTNLLNHVNMKKKLEEKFLADIVAIPQEKM